MLKGSCLCGQVAYQVTPPIKVFQYCHCSRCRKVTGSAHAANMFVDTSQFKWLLGQELVGRYEPQEAKYFATCFCKSCGSSLPWQAKQGQTMIIPAGSLNDDPEIRPQQNIHWASRAPWFCETSDLAKYDALPPRNKPPANK